MHPCSMRPVATVPRPFNKHELMNSAQKRQYIRTEQITIFKIMTLEQKAIQDKEKTRMNVLKKLKLSVLLSKG